MTKTIIAIGEAGSIEVDTGKFNKAVNDYIFNYGLKQMLNDVHAGMTKKVEADDAKRKAGKLALVEKKLASLYDGHVAQARVGGGDPVAKEMRNMAETFLKGQLRKLGKKPGDYTKETWHAVIAKELAANETEYREKAEAKLAIKPEVSAKDATDILAMLEEVKG
jgi:hypothetical protein